MNYRLFIARRYLFSKKSHNAINIISAISACGVAIATLALVCTLSVFNGFQDLVADLFTSFDPELQVAVAEGTVVEADDPVLQQIAELPEVEVCTQCLEGQALMVNQGRQVVVTLKGVSDNWGEQVDLKQILYPANDNLVLHADVLEYGLVGLQLATQLGLTADFPNPIPVYAPKRGQRVNMANPLSSFNSDELQSPGCVFVVRQSKYDAHYIVTSLGFAQRLFDQRGRISQLELKLRPGSSVSAVQRKVQQLAGKRFVVRDRYEQQEDVFRIMRIEKLIAYLFLTFILLIACFNIVGSLSMLMIEKKDDVRTLHNLGATDAHLRSVFLLEGRLISLFGALAGLVLGVALCWVQQEYGLLAMGDAEGTFIVESYPVSVHLWDIVLIFATVVAVSWFVMWYPVRYLFGKLNA